MYYNKKMVDEKEFSYKLVKTINMIKNFVRIRVYNYWRNYNHIYLQNIKYYL